MAKNESICRLILNALNDKKYRARTIQGIAKYANISPSEVIHELNSNKTLNQQVKIYPRKSKDGKVLITTRERFDKTAPLKDRFIEAFATTRVIIEDEY
ncbi:MAG: hypothetical protein RPU41_13970 [Candidatus Sedimenticola sp. (ex Thyasira tokunagai)]